MWDMIQARRKAALEAAEAAEKEESPAVSVPPSSAFQHGLTVKTSESTEEEELGGPVLVTPTAQDEEGVATSEEEEEESTPTTTTPASSTGGWFRRQATSSSVKEKDSRSVDPKEVGLKNEEIASLNRKLVVEQTSHEVLQEKLVQLQTEHQQELLRKQVELDQLQLEKEQLDKALDKLIHQDLSVTVEGKEDEDSETKEAEEEVADDDEETNDERKEEEEQDNEEQEDPLAKTLQQLQVTQSYVADLKEMHAAYAKTVSEQLVKLGEEKVEMEVSYLNRIDQLEHEKKLSEQALLAKLEVKQVRLAHLEETLDEYMSSSSSSKHGSDGNESTTSPGDAEAVLAVSQLKEDLENMTTAKEQLEREYKAKQDEHVTEIERLRKANETKQRLIDRFQTNDALAELEKSAEMGWNRDDSLNDDVLEAEEREQLHDVVVTNQEEVKPSVRDRRDDDSRDSDETGSQEESSDKTAEYVGEKNVPDGTNDDGSEEVSTKEVSKLKVMSGAQLEQRLARVNRYL